MAIDRDLGRRSPPMRSPGTIDDRARDIAPDGVPFNFYNRGPMDPPSRRFPIPMPMPNPFPDPRMPMPSPGPREGLPPRDELFPRPLPEFAVPLPSPPPGSIPPPFSVPPGMGPFRPQPFPDMERMQPVPMPNIRAPREGMGPAGMTQQEMRRETGAFDMPNSPGREGIMDSLMDSFRNNYKNLLPPFARPTAAVVDPSDYRTILKMIEQGLDPEDYMNRGGIASLLQ